MPLPSPNNQRQLGQIDPDIQAVMSSPAYKTMPQIDFSDPFKAIASLDAMFKQLGTTPLDPRVVDSEQTYTTRDGTALRLAIYTPASALQSTTTRLPVLIWYHGGGGCTGSPEMNAPFLRDFAVTQNCVVITPQYRLAPTFKFPTGMLDCWDAAQHIAQHASSISTPADASQGLVLGGESYGAVIAAYTTLRGRDETLHPPISGVLLSAGSYTPPHNVPDLYKPHYLSRFDDLCLASPGLSKEMKAAFDLALQPDYDSPICRATLWPRGHKGLPRTYFQTCGLDINRDEAFVYRDVLEKAGVETRLDVYPGCPHCFWWTFPKVPMAAKWAADTRKGLAWLFGKT